MSNFNLYIPADNLPKPAEARVCVPVFSQSVQSCNADQYVFFISQRDLGGDQTSPRRARRGVPGQPGEGQHQPDSAGRASSAQVNTNDRVFSTLCAAASDLAGNVPRCFCGTEGEGFMADGGDRWWIFVKSHGIKITSKMFMLFR